MAIIYQPTLFSWKDIEDLGDLERLQLVLETMPDENLMHILEKERGNGRNNHPVRAVWNSVLAGIVFEHGSIESLRRELKRNAQLRDLCGFDPLKGAYAVPSKSAYSRFIVKLLEHGNLIDSIFDSLVEKLREILPNFGRKIAFDGKAIQTFAKGSKNKDASGADDEDEDRRRDNDANWGCKKYHGVDANGTPWEKLKSWFGYKIHLIVEAEYELPVAYEVTKASTGEAPVMEQMFEDLEICHPELVEDCEYAMGDKGYDTVNLVSKLWDEYCIKPIVDIRNLWKDGEETRLLKTRDFQNVTYDYKGAVFCHCPQTGEVRPMCYGGFEADRGALKYLCPAQHKGITCKGEALCPVRQGIRIPLYEDRRIFSPVARSSYKWTRLYNKRTSVERVNSRLDVSFGFEKHYIRGLKKMRVRCGLALCVMLAMALGRVRQNRHGLIRSLVRTAA